MQQFIGFNINSSEYMIPILKVREIISMPSITALPHLPSYVKGVTNLRGSIIPIVNLKYLLNSYASEGDGNTVIVLATGKIIFGIIVDGITGVVKADESDIEPPENFFNNNIDNIEGVAKLNNKLIVLLNTKKLLPLDDMSLFEDAIVEVNETDNGNSVEITREIDTIGGKVIIKEMHDAKQYFSDKIKQNDPKQNAYNMILNFMNALSDHEYQKAEVIVEQLVKETDTGLFREVGKITRKLHDSLEEFKGSIDSGLQRLTKDDVPNAIDKLQFVITKTEDAANKTMGIVERYFEESNEFTRHVENLKGNDESVNYLRIFKDSLDNDMTTILTAQQFQDITGQTIKKVIDLVNQVEVEMLTLITKFGMQVKTEPAKTAVAAGSDQAAMTDSEGKMAEKVTQSDVEALLNDFGF
ncbi:MAG: protein phosphatase CheZ [Nitrospirae bacterium]|nr:protein phosphatase CheZ [Nitrospirota bacterium]